MKAWSLYVGKIFGIPVFVHWTFWILIVWIFLMQVGTNGSFDDGLRAVLFISLLFVCVVLHEFGHALTAKRFGVVTRNITLYPIGGISSFESMPERPVHELLISLAGPSVNILIAIVLWVYLSLSGQVVDLSSIEGKNGQIATLPFTFSLLLANLILATFNLIPAFPMDGGRVFRAVLGLAMDKTTATRIAASLGQFLAIVFVSLGFFYNFWLVFIGLFIFLGAGGEAAFEQTRSALEGLTVKDALMRRFTVLRPDDNLSTAVDSLLNSQETEFVVVDDRRPVGLLTRKEIVKGISEMGNEAAVSAFMITNFFTVHPQTALGDFFQQSLSTGRNIALVMEEDSLVGLIDIENVEEKLMVNSALMHRDH